jgi:arylsulfatase A-like enzyme
MVSAGEVGYMKIRPKSRMRHTGFAISFVVLVAVLLSCVPERGLERPNIVLIVIDALRPDHLGCYGYQRPTSPVIDELADTGILFETAISAAPWTKTSFSSFLTSLYPFQHGVVEWVSIMPDSISTLSEVLHGHGYNTMALVNMLGITDRFKVLKGTDQVSAAAKYKRDAGKATDDAIELMAGSPEPYFIIIHYFDTHWPYRPPMKYVDTIRDQSDPEPFVIEGPSVDRDGGVIPQEVREREVTMYDACIRYVDENVARLVGFLEESGTRDQTVLMITADHGEAFWEHGFGSHGRSVYDEEIRVPLIFNNPVRYRTARRIEEQVSLIDLVPTIVDLAGAEDSRHREGRNLNDLVDTGRSRRREGSFLPADIELCESTLKKAPDTKGIRSNHWKLIIEPATSLVELYNMLDDPRETENVWGKGGAVGDSLLRLIEQVPGSGVGGWRLGFVNGDTAVVFSATARLSPGQRFTAVDRLVAGGDFTLEVSDDRTSFHVEVSPNGQQIILFSAEPEDAAIKFEFAVNGEAASDLVSAGGERTYPMGEVFTVTRDEAYAVPEAFGELRRSGKTGACVWWLPGRRRAEAGETTGLSPEEKQRLKALGYIQ